MYNTSLLYICFDGTSLYEWYINGKSHPAPCIPFLATQTVSVRFNVVIISIGETRKKKYVQCVTKREKSLYMLKINS